MRGVTVVVVTFNSEQFIEPCILSCLHAGVTRVIVVDNNSEDGTRARVEKHAGVTLIANRDNAGFAAAANQGFAAADTPLVLVLNPDTELLNGLHELARACGRPGVGASAGMLVDETGRPQQGFNLRRFPTPPALAFEALGINRLFPSNSVNRHYRCLDLDPATALASVEQPAGAFLLVRRDVWINLGGFDEQFHPVWFEDVDFCKRLCDAGYRIQYSPSVRARHAGGHSIGGMSFECRQVYWYASLLKYASKHLTRWGNIWVSVAVMLGSVPRLITGMVRERSLQQPFGVFGRIMQLAVRNIVSGRPGELVNSPDVFDKSRRRAG